MHLTTPNRFHFEQAAACLRAGKHVLCEKPLAMNSRESAELVRIAASTRRAAGVAYNIRSLLSDSARAIASYPGGHNEGFPDTFKQLFRRFYGYIAAGDFHAPPPFPTFADGDQEIRLCEAVLQSHREQRWVNVQDSIP